MKTLPVNDFHMRSTVLLTTATAALHIGHSPVRHVSVSTITMKSLLHVYDPDSSTALSAYLDKRRCEPAASFDEAPKLAHSIALALDGALDSASLGGGSIAQTIVISEAEDMEVGEACLRALGCPDVASLYTRNFDEHRLVGFCCSPDADLAEGSLKLINGARVAGFRAPPDGMQPILDATEVLADELEEHFELVIGADQSIVVYGGRASDGCVVGVLGMRDKSACGAR